MFQTLLLISFFVGNYFGFRITLKLLKVNKSIDKRAILLSISFLIVQVLSVVVTSYIGLVEPAGTVISIVLFGFILKKFLILELWQVIVIPIGVSLFSGLVFAVFFYGCTEHFRFN